MATVLERLRPAPVEPKIAIERDIPIPPDRRGSRHKYPFREMEIGDSFFVPGARSNRFGAICAYWHKRLGRNFTLRTVSGGVRVWRTA